MGAGLPRYFFGALQVANQETGSELTLSGESRRIGA
jgi:hypothetical protein